MGCLFQTSGGGSVFWGDAVADLASLPAAGNTTGTIRQTLDTTYLYRWDGAAWDLYYDGTGGGGFTNPMTTNGDLITQTAGVPARIGIGANGTVLSSNGTAASWQVVSGTGDVVGPASSTDNAVARFDLATGKLLHNSVVLIDDVGVVTGITSLTVDNINIDGNTIISTNANGNVVIDPNGTGFLASEAQIRLPEIATPTTPASGYGMLYFKTDGIAYSLNDAGTETALSGGGGSGDVVGPASSTDNAVARFDLATGKLIQNSVVLIDDVGVVTGITQLNVDNLRLDGNVLSTTNTNGDLTLTPNGTGTVIVSTDLDVDNININANTISSLDTNGNILLDPNGTGFVSVESAERLAEVTAPGTPASGYGYTYFKSDGAMYGKNDSGVEYPLGEQIAFLSDVKTANTDGGTLTLATWNTRTLNTISDAYSIASLSSNQFTLVAGNYMIEADAPAYQVQRHKIRLQNITDGTTDSVGTSELSATTNPSQTRSRIQVRLTLSTSKTFEIQHNCQSTVASLGAGVASNLSVSEVYCMVKITKIP